MNRVKSKDLLTLRDYSVEEVGLLLEKAAAIKKSPGAYRKALDGRTLAMIFEKPSLRTRVTFEVGIVQLGGRAVYLSGGEIGLGARESVEDVARNLSRWVDGIAARVYSHDSVVRLAAQATIPVINALSDFEHPCQAFADYFTLWERGIDLSTMRLGWIGDGNNVCHSIVLMGALLGGTMVVACPPGYEPDRSVQARVAKLGGRLVVTHDPREAATGADVLYTDVWTSMGQEAEREQRLEAFGRFQVNETVLAFAKPSALVMHCLPAHRGEEITDGVLDGSHSVVLDQSENRLHGQKAIIMQLLGGALEDV
jgi:ornithine carbamoyltransferase